MAPAPDLGPGAQRLGDLVRGVDDARLSDPTPCEGRTVSQLLGHLHGLAQAFRASADKELGPLTDTDPDQAGWPEAPPGWREDVPELADRLARAWQRPEAWTGTTRAGGVEAPAEVMGLVALSEVTLHGWDLARATGQPFQPDDATLAALAPYVEQFAPAGTPGMFGPAVDAGSAGGFDGVLARTGRDPGWQPPATV